MTDLDLAPHDVEGVPVTSEAIAAVAFAVLAWFGFIVVGDVLAYVYARRVVNDPGAGVVADEMATAARKIAFVHLIVMGVLAAVLVTVLGVFLLGSFVHGNFSETRTGIVGPSVSSVSP